MDNALRPKKDKKDVHYSKGYMPAHCGICKHFESPSSCELVRGFIDKTMWCKLFKKKE